MDMINKHVASATLPFLTEVAVRKNFSGGGGGPHHCNANRNFSRRIHFQGRAMLERADKRRREIVKDRLNDAFRDTLEKTSN